MHGIEMQMNLARVRKVAEHSRYNRKAASSRHTKNNGRAIKARPPLY
jgi:hypothetical protein